MFDYLDKLRAKPVHVRKRIAFITTVTLSLFVAVVWVGTFHVERPASTTFVAKEANTRSPWGVVSDMLKHTKGEMTAAVSEATTQLTEVAAGTVEYDPSKNSPATTDETPLRNTESDVEASEDVPVFPDTLDTDTASEALHTRPGTFESDATGTVAGDVIQ